MSRYIDAEALDREFSKLRFNNDGELEHYGDRPNWYLWGSEVEDLIANAPSIDIVRCKECKHWRNTDAEKIPTASIACGNMHPDDFCSYGERSKR